MRKQIAAANWKMNLTLDKAETLLDTLLEQLPNLKEDQHVVFAVPSPYLLPAQKRIGNTTNVFAAAQNCYSKASGAYTGEVKPQCRWSSENGSLLVRAAFAMPGSCRFHH